MPDASPATLIFDGDCGFCTRWARRWEALAGGKMVARSSDEAAADFPAIPPEAYQRAVQWVGRDGFHCEAGEAVFRAMALYSPLGRALLWLYLRVALFRKVVEAVYALVARQRMFFSLLTRWIWGSDLTPPTFQTGCWLFLRGLGAVYLIAFVSYWRQFSGLLSKDGILPFQEYLSGLTSSFGDGLFWHLPTLFWWLPSDAAVVAVCFLGVVLSLLLIAGIAQGPVLLLLWFAYLSIIQIGQVFYAFQWDNLLLEAGFCALFLVVWKQLLAWRAPLYTGLGRLLLLWLAFRLFVASGVVKLSSGDAVWQNLTALQYHFFTQPLPNPVAWYLQHLPDWMLKTATGGMFFVELVLPIFLFAPRNLRLVAAGGLLALQLAIFASGNYGFFNLLSALLVLAALDDRFWPAKLTRFVQGAPVENSASRPGLLFRIGIWIRAGLACLVVIVSLVPFLASFRTQEPMLKPLNSLYRPIAPFRSVNGYGLFSVMTTSRAEILVQGTADGFNWETYTFRYKPGALDRRPPLAWFYMPRLDWQMWFASLGHAQQNPWFFNFMQRLLEGNPQILDLLEENPFPEEPPRMVRALMDDYRFSSPAERREQGVWWTAEPVRIYADDLRLR